MDIRSIVEALEAEQDRLDRALEALQPGSTKRGKSASGRSDERNRRLSAAARKRISNAVKKEWDAIKKQRN